jgi:hypothetical protein
MNLHDEPERPSGKISVIERPNDTRGAKTYLMQIDGTFEDDSTATAIRKSQFDVIVQAKNIVELYGDDPEEKLGVKEEVRGMIRHVLRPIHAILDGKLKKNPKLSPLQKELEEALVYYTFIYERLVGYPTLHRDAALKLARGATSAYINTHLSDQAKRIYAQSRDFQHEKKSQDWTWLA